MSKVLVATSKPFDSEAIDLMRIEVVRHGHDLVLLENYSSEAELLAAVSDADALIVRSDLVTPTVIEAATQLKIVVRAGAGYDNIDLSAASAHGIVVENTPGQNSNAVAELAIAMMLFQARGKFNGGTGTELKGKTLGIHGLGNVGQCIDRKSVG